MKIKRPIILILLSASIALITTGASVQADFRESEVNRGGSPALTIATVRMPASQGVIVIPEVFTVAPNQPVPEHESTVGLINALCDVTLNLVGCAFTPTSVTIVCDTNGDGLPELMIPLKNIVILNRLVIQATLPALTSDLSGSPFPLSCCGGVARLTLSRTITSGDDNVFGPFTQTLSCPIDLGLRAPVVLSASPSNVNCAVSQNILIPGSCFILPDGKPNVTSVYAVDRDNPNHIVQATNFQIMTPNLIDALFDFGAGNAGKSFVIYVSGPNGTSRNLTMLPVGAPANCPLGNEAGTLVTVRCNGVTTGPGTGGIPVPGNPNVIVSCQLDRDSSGAFTLKLRVAGGVPDNSIITVGGVAPRKVKFKDPDPGSNPPRFTTIVLKGRICQGLPGPALITIPGGATLDAFACNDRCSN